MPIYSFDGCDATGSPERGSIEATSEKLAYDTLSSRGIIVFDMFEGPNKALKRTQPWYLRDLELGSGQVSVAQQAVTAELMATLFDAKLSVPDVLRVVSTTSENKNIQRFFIRIKQRVDDGDSFAEAFKLENKHFSPIFVSFLQVAETSNSFSDFLVELANLLKRQNKLQQKIAIALVYPGILVCAACVLILVVILYLAPNLEPIFSTLDRKPPSTLGKLLSLNDSLRDHWLIICTGSIFAVVGLVIARQQPAFQIRMTQLKFQLPLLGRTVRLSNLTQLSLATDLLLRSGLGQAEALRKAAHSIKPSSPFSTLFEEASYAIEAGQSASHTFSQDRHLPQVFKELYQVGEEANRVPEMLSALASEFGAQVERDTDRWLALLTPTLTLVLGLGIGLLVHTLMGAILEVNELAF